MRFFETRCSSEGPLFRKSTLCLKKTGPLLRFDITPTNCA